jgi:ubiquinone/menaquinone biosynthesis C-methylase UbiE
MENDLEKKIFCYPPKAYQPSYDSTDLRGIEDPRPWTIQTEIKKYATLDKKLLDIGCGTAFKIIPICNEFEKVYAIDISYSMLEQAKINAQNKDIKNFVVQYGDGKNLPFKDSSFDVVTAILSQWQASEIYRVLKPGGIAIIENHGGADKINIKREFGSDKNGWRGQFMNNTPEQIAEIHKQMFVSRFKRVEMREGNWKTYYTRSGLEQLLNNTPLIRNYNHTKDKALFEKVIEKYNTEKGIETTQHRILVTAFK